MGMGGMRRSELQRSRKMAVGLQASAKGDVWNGYRRGRGSFLLFFFHIISVIRFGRRGMGGVYQLDTILDQQGALVCSGFLS